MKYIFLQVFALFIVMEGIQAQVTVSLGTYSGKGSTNVLLSTSTTSNRYSRTISLYSASEIIAAGGMAGTVTKLAWDKYGTGEYTSNDAYIKVYLKHVSDTSWSTVPDWNTQVVGATEVFSSTTYSIPTGTGWKDVVFTTPFFWNGIDHVAVFVEWDRSSAPTNAIEWGRSSNTDANATRVGSTSLAALVLMVNSNRPLLQLTITAPIIAPVTDVNVYTQGGAPATISTAGGTRQMIAEVLPVTASQKVTWSIVPGTGMATIDTNGLVTAQSNGTVWAKAVSVQDTAFMDSLQLVITNQPVPIDSIDVRTMGGVPATITKYAGTLQLEALVYPPATANQSVNWSVVPGTGTATISGTGLLTAQTDGTVWAKAISVQDPTMKDSLKITISMQPDSLRIETSLGGPPVIDVLAGTLQLKATVYPTALSQGVNWSILNGSGQASISGTGLVTAIADGTVRALALSSTYSTNNTDTLEITITNQGTGIALNTDEYKFLISPNPVRTNQIHGIIESPSSSAGILTLFSLSGEAITMQPLEGSEFFVDVRDLPAGMYILQFNNGQQIIQRKVSILKE